MKRIIAVLVVALAGLAACTKRDAQIDGRFVAQLGENAYMEITIVSGDCVSFREEYADGSPAVNVTGFKTSGSWPDYTFTAKGKPDYSAMGGVTNFTIQAHFLNRDSFTVIAGGIITCDDGTTTALEVKGYKFKRFPANFVYPAK